LLSVLLLTGCAGSAADADPAATRSPSGEAAEVVGEAGEDAPPEDQGASGDATDGGADGGAAVDGGGENDEAAGGGSTPATGGGSAGDPSPAPATAKPLPKRLCGMLDGPWRGYVDTAASATSQDNALRESLPLLESLVSDWQVAVERYPAGADAVALVADAAGYWRVALTELDNGNTAAADAALGDAAAAVRSLDAELDELNTRRCR
jgi:hypothetical protein